EETKFLRRVNDPVFRQPAGMSHQHGGIRKELENEIAIARSVQTIRRDSGKPEFFGDGFTINWKIRACDRPRSKWKNVHAAERFFQTLVITAEHLDKSPAVVAPTDRLRPPHMCIGGDDDFRISRSALYKRKLQSFQVRQDESD